MNLAGLGDWLRKWEFVAIGVVQMEVPFAPFCIPWPIGIEFLLFQVSPKLVYVSDIENDPSPITGHVTLLEVENCISCAERLKRRKTSSFASIENLQAQQLVVKMHGFCHIAYLDRDGGYSVYIHISLLAPSSIPTKALLFRSSFRWR